MSYVEKFRSASTRDCDGRTPLLVTERLDSRCSWQLCAQMGSQRSRSSGSAKLAVVLPQPGDRCGGCTARSRTCRTAVAIQMADGQPEGKGCQA
jgi:hypothetical protein